MERKEKERKDAAFVILVDHFSDSVPRFWVTYNTKHLALHPLGGKVSSSDTTPFSALLRECSEETSLILDPKLFVFLGTKDCETSEAIWKHHLYFYIIDEEMSRMMTPSTLLESKLSHWESFHSAEVGRPQTKACVDLITRVFERPAMNCFSKSCQFEKEIQ